MLEFLFVSCHLPGATVDYHSHRALEIVYYTEGEGELRIENQEGSFSPGDFHVAPEGCRHRQHNNTELRAICLGVSGSGLEDLCGIWRDASGILRYPCEKLLMEHKDKEPGWELVSKGLLMQIAGSIRRIVSSPKTQSPQRKGLVEQALHIIRESDGRLSLEELSDTLYISKDYLRHLITRNTGRSPLQHIISSRMGKAQKLLLQGKGSVAEIASLCGFSDVYYFSKLFKRHFKLPPASYRRKMTGKDK